MPLNDKLEKAYQKGNRSELVDILARWWHCGSIARTCIEIKAYYGDQIMTWKENDIWIWNL